MLQYEDVRPKVPSLDIFTQLALAFNTKSPSLIKPLLHPEVVLSANSLEGGINGNHWVFEFLKRNFTYYIWHDDFVGKHEYLAYDVELYATTSNAEDITEESILLVSTGYASEYKDIPIAIQSSEDNKLIKKIHYDTPLTTRDDLIHIRSPELHQKGMDALGYEHVHRRAIIGLTEALKEGNDQLLQFAVGKSYINGQPFQQRFSSTDFFKAIGAPEINLDSVLAEQVQIVNYQGITSAKLQIEGSHDLILQGAVNWIGKIFSLGISKI